MYMVPSRGGRVWSDSEGVVGDLGWCALRRGRVLRYRLNLHSLGAVFIDPGIVCTPEI